MNSTTKSPAYVYDCTGHGVDRNNCAVRAVAIACEVPYEQAYAEFKRRGREDGDGVRLIRMIRDNPEFFGKTLVCVFDRTDEASASFTTAKKPARIWLSRCCKMFSKGRYVVRRRGHAMALVDGVIHDQTTPSSREYVTHVWQVIG